MTQKKNSDGPLKQGPWLIHGEEIAFRNPWLAVHTYPVTMPNGEPGTYGVVRFENLATGVLPLDDEGYTWLVGQHRFPLNAYSWELPEGGTPKGEAAEDGARRELEEEVGLKADALTEIGRWHLSNSVTDERAIAYVATGLSQGVTDPDPSEVLETKRVSFGELLDLVISGEITDAFTVLMVQTAYIRAQRGQLPDEVCDLILKTA